MLFSSLFWLYTKSGVWKNPVLYLLYKHFFKNILLIDRFVIELIKLKCQFWLKCLTFVEISI